MTIQRNGNCFQAAIQTYRELAFSYPRAFIVHGTPLGRGPDNLDKRYWHAWVEVKDPDRGWLVIDRSNGLNVALPRGEYYTRGRLHGGMIFRFTGQQAAVEIHRRDHSGPWVDNWESYDETVTADDASGTV